MVFNTPFGRGPRTDGSVIRTAAVRAGIPCITTVQGILAAVQGIEALREARSLPLPLQEYHASGPGRNQPALVEEPRAAAASTGRSP